MMRGGGGGARGMGAHFGLAINAPDEKPHVTWG